MEDILQEAPAGCDLAACCLLRNTSEHEATLSPLVSGDFIPFPNDPHTDLGSYYVNYNSDVHDLNLTNLSIWAKRHDLHYMSFGHYIIYVYYPRDRENLYFSEPVGDTDNQDALKQALLDWASWCRELKLPLRLRRVCNLVREISLKLFSAIDVEPIPDAYDYCYNTEDLAHLSGNRYHKKKNHLNQFIKKHDGRYHFAPITADNASDALTAAANWCKTNGCKGDFDLCFEFRGIADLLARWNHFSALGLEGVVVYVDNKPVALTLAEPWVNATLLVHIEKGDTQFPGIYAAVNNALAKQALGRFKYLNREQDMGIEGIRKSKQSYLPSHLVEKSNLTVT